MMDSVQVKETACNSRSGQSFLTPDCSDACAVYFKKTPKNSVSSSILDKFDFGSDSDDSESTVQLHYNRLNSSETDDIGIASKWRCASSEKCDSAIDLSTISLDRVSTAGPTDTSRICGCNCHNNRFAKLKDYHSQFQERSTQKPLQVSISLPAYTNGAYSGLKELYKTSPWPQRKNLDDLDSTVFAGLVNPNSNNNSNGTLSTVKSTSHSGQNKTAVTGNHIENRQQQVETGKTTDPLGNLNNGKSIFQKHRALCIIFILVVVITLAIIGVLVYFVVAMQHMHDSGSTPEDPFFTLPSAPHVVLNQTKECGFIPSSYLPPEVEFLVTPITVPYNYTTPENDSPTLGIEERIVGGKLTHIKKYPWQSKSAPVSVRLQSGSKSLKPLFALPKMLRRRIRIIGGEDTSVAQLPWQAVLYANRRFVCGASIILKNWIVTAAHCMDEREDPSIWEAYFGVTSLSSKKQGVKRNITMYITNPNYQNSHFSFDYDITLMKLDKPLDFGLYIQPICIPPQGYEFVEGMECYVSGWGVDNDEGLLPSPNILQHAQVDVIGNETCNRDDFLSGYVSSRMMCAGKVEGGVDSCHGDSGGPLSCYFSEEGKWVLGGIVSWGVGCGKPKLPGVYAKASYFTNWIWTEIGKADGLIPTVKPPATTADNPSSNLTHEEKMEYISHYFDEQQQLLQQLQEQQPG